MKKTFTVLSAICTIAAATAQPWCPVLGTQWWHTYGSFSLSGHVVTTYTSDTLIAGQTWQQLSSLATYQNLSTSNPPVTESWSVLTRIEGNAVFLRQFEEVDTLYRFEAEIGESWSVPFSDIPMDYLVTDRGELLLDGVELAWSAVDVRAYLEGSDEGFVWIQDTLVERLGFRHQYIVTAWSLSLEPHIDGLRCYSDEEIDHQVQEGLPCEVAVQIGEVVEAELVDMRYEAGTGRLNVAFSGATAGTYQFVDMSGRVWQHGVLRPGATLFDTSELPEGMYALRIFNGSGFAWSRKWVK